VFKQKLSLPSADKALPGRDQKIRVNPSHAVNGNSIVPPFPDGFMQALFGLGCFWGAERKFWQLNGVYSTAVGYAAGVTPNPSYEEVCSGMTGHNEVVLVVYDPSVINYEDLLMMFFESHNPTQGMRQGNDQGTQYRSGIYVYSDEQRELAKIAMDNYQSAITQQGFGRITTELQSAGDFFYAEEYHQQYLHKNPQGYCGLGGTGVCFPD